MGNTKYNIADILISALGYKGTPFPGGFIPPTPPKYGVSGGEYTYNTTISEKTSSALGSTLRKKDAQGNWYFLPVTLNGVELPNTIISIKGKKTIVETAMVGRRGTVKELISVDDYEIEIAGVAFESDYPDEMIAELNNLYTINESISLKCALTDIFLEDEDKVVIKSIEFPPIQGYETSQAYKMSLVTDRSFELVIE
ncbi:MAG: DUF6046 domain-containing protein [Rikenellaceae bacterium]